MIELDVSILVSGERKTDAELAMENGFIMYWKAQKTKRIENNFDTSKYKSYLVSNNEKVKYILKIFL